MAYTSCEFFQAPVHFNIIDTSKFTMDDLKLFVDSIETISRIERKKYERKLHQSNSDGASSANTDGDSIDERNMNGTTDDGDNSNDRSILTRIKRRSQSFRKTIVKTCEFTSRVLMEAQSELKQHRPRSVVMTDPKKKPTRARIIRLIFKKTKELTAKCDSADVKTTPDGFLDAGSEKSLNHLEDDLSIFSNLPRRCRRPLFIDTDESENLERALQYLAL